MARPRARALLVLLTLAAIAMLAAAPAHAQQAVNVETVDTPVHRAFHTLVVSHDTGEVQVVPGTHPSIHEVRRWNVIEPTLTHEVKNGVLTVTTECPQGLQVGLLALGGFNDCSQDLLITVPRSTVVRAEVGLGDVLTRGLVGSQTLHADLGDVAIEGVIGSAIEARSGLGHVRLERIVANEVTALAESGGVEVTLARAARRLTAISDHGDVVARVPAGRYVVRASSDLGDVIVRGVVRDRRAERRITAVSDLGDVTIIGVR